MEFHGGSRINSTQSICYTITQKIKTKKKKSEGFHESLIDCTTIFLIVIPVLFLYLTHPSYIGDSNDGTDFGYVLISYNLSGWIKKTKAVSLCL